MWHEFLRAFYCYRCNIEIVDCDIMLVVSCSVEDIFAAIENDPEPSATKYLVRASYLQIYNEVSLHGWQHVQSVLLLHVTLNTERHGPFGSRALRSTPLRS